MKKILCIFVGHAFRFLERVDDKTIKTVDEERSIDEQINAVETHVKLYEHLTRKFSVNVDFAIMSYKSQHETLLLEAYKKMPQPLFTVFLSDSLGYARLLTEANARIKPYQDQYESILFIRIDIHLSDLFIQLLNPYTEKIVFTHLLGPPGDPTKFNEELNSIETMYAADMFIQVPKKYYHVLQHNFLGHGVTRYLTEKHNVPPQDLTFLVKTIHRASNNIGWNPLYRVVNRPNAQPVARAQNLTAAYDETLFKLIHSNTFKSFTEMVEFYNSEYEATPIQKTVKVSDKSILTSTITPNEETFTDITSTLNDMNSFDVTIQNLLEEYTSKINILTTNLISDIKAASPSSYNNTSTSQSFLQKLKAFFRL